MQAIILAAGMGRRLGEYTENNTKCMLPVNGKRLIDRMLEKLNREQLSRIVLVVGYEAQNLIDHLKAHYHGQVPLEFIENPIYDKTNNIYSLALAKKQLLEDDTLLLESDLIFDDTLLPMLVQDPRPNVALVAKYETWMDGTMVCINDDLDIVNFVPKKAFRYADIDRYYKTVNIYKFSRDFSQQMYVPFLDAYIAAMGDNEYYEQVLRILTLLDRSGIKALPIGDAKWYEIDDVQDLDIAETIFGEKEQLMHRYNMRYGGHWRFPKLLDFCYLVNPYFPTTRMKEELKANFDVLLSEYPSGMYVNALLGGKYFNVRQDYTVVGNGAAELIKALMERLEGRIGVVFPTFQEYPNRKAKTAIVSYMPQGEAMTYGVDELMTFYADKALQSLLLINPDNPSGNFIPTADVLRLAAWCEERQIRLVVDESFVDFTEGFEHNSLLHNEILQAHPTMVVLKSISKSYGVPGLRLGVAVSADTALIGQLKRDVAIWNINSFAEFYLQIFGKYTADYHRACVRFIEERERFEKRLQTIPFLEVFPSQANYFMCAVRAPYTSASLTLKLLQEHDILVKDCDNKEGLQGKNYIRISVRNSADNDALIEALEQC